MQLKAFRDEFLELMLRFLWRQWSALGVAGYKENENKRVVDPEALLAVTGTFARYDQRLFDEVLDWVDVNERFINVQRLRNILKSEGFASASVLGAMAAKQFIENKGIKWKGLYREYRGERNPLPLFYMKNSRGLPVVGEKDQVYLEYGFVRNPVMNRGLSRPFPPREIPTLNLELRALFGLNSRSEIMLYLLINKEGSIQKIAEQTYYAWRSVQDVLYELGHSALVNFPDVKKGRIYYLNSELWKRILLKKSDLAIQWICWPPLFRALELIWEKLGDECFSEMTELEQAAELKSQMTSELLPRYIKAGLGTELKNTTGYWGVEYLERWIEGLKDILG